MKEELLKGLTKEQIAKVKQCKSHEELLALAKQESIELTDEQLAAISGGCNATVTVQECPYCGCTWVAFVSKKRYKCLACNRKFDRN